jgi:hypothetical protein
MERTGWSATLKKLQKELLQAGIYKTPGNFLSLAVILASVGFILGRFANNFLVSALIALIAGPSPFYFVHKKEEENQPDREADAGCDGIIGPVFAGRPHPAFGYGAGKP